MWTTPTVAVFLPLYLNSYCPQYQNTPPETPVLPQLFLLILYITRSTEVSKVLIFLIGELILEHKIWYRKYWYFSIDLQLI